MVGRFVADGGDDGLERAGDDVRGVPELFDLGDHLVDPVGRGVGFDDDDHRKRGQEATQDAPPGQPPIPPARTGLRLVRIAA